jgi:hypothetical protein
MAFRKVTAALGLIGGLLVAGQAHALWFKDDGTRFEIDDWAITGTSEADTDVANPDTAARGTGGAGYWVNGGTRDGELYAFLLSGDRAVTRDCGNCGVGETVNDSNSIGHHYFTIEDPFGDRGFTANAGDMIGFDYEADIEGADYFVSFNLDGTKVGETIQWSDVAATGLSGRPLDGSLMGTLSTTFDFNSIRIDIFSIGGTYVDESGWLGAVDLGNEAVGLDTNIADNIPEPASIALLGLGLLGLGWQRRRAAAA